MKLHTLNEYMFLDKNRDTVKVGDVILFQKDGYGGQDGWAKGIVKNIDGNTILITNLEAKAGEPTETTVKTWKKIDKA